MRVFKTGMSLLLCTAFIIGMSVYAKSADTNLQKLASYTTYFSEGNSGRNRNMQLGSEKNSVTIRSGSSFSFQRNTGNSTSTANGWSEAPILESGKRTVGIGGGLCQVASTIYSAVKQVDNLAILERHPHSVAVGYVPVSGEAMVNYGSSDFRFRNDNSFDITISIAIDIYEGWMKATVYKVGKGGQSQRDITVQIDGDRLYSNVAPRIYNDRVYVEMRSLFEAMGFSVKYNADTNTVRMKRGSVEYVLRNGSESKTITRIKNGNEKSISISYPLKNVSGRIMIPLRFVGDLTGYYVEWDAAERIAYLWS